MKVSTITVATVLLTSCAPSDSGFVLRVDNQCSERVGFAFDGGPAPVAPGPARAHLEPGTVDEYGVLAGDNGGYIQLRDPKGIACELPDTVQRLCSQHSAVFHIAPAR